MAVVGDDTGTYLIDTTGKEIPGTRIGFWANIEPDYDERYICFYDCDEVDPDTAEHPAGLYDTKARMILCELAYRDYYEYDEDTIEVTENPVRPGETCAWLIDSIGALKYPWQAGMECASIDQPDENGNIIFARMTIEETEESQTCIRREGKCYKHRYWYGLVNRNGKILLQPEYESLWFIGKDLYGAVKDGKTIVFEAE